ncbi:ChaN family lipoprotein [Thiomicrorhabdus cannonii]|uniref:ChaN family lipoprotein n=1 Tax=Thiomicrorhabdus cannonii TaxID=2748011 RepID=UPI0015B96639|nr:ChaN family lipoprotein [Thiomicrorhabdus cannonii]
MALKARYIGIAQVVLFSLWLLGGCSSVREAPDITTLYDYQLMDSGNGRPLTLTALVPKLADRDVIFIGEFHGNHASHLLEAQLQALLYQQRPQQILSMEQFERHQQPLLSRYLDGEIGEAYLINEAPAWENYAGSYRPLVEFAKQHLLPVVAANAPGDIIRCIGRHGDAYINRLPPEERRWIAEAPFADIPEYAERFRDWMQNARHLSDEQAHNSYLAQLTRDNTMAESIAKALQEHPGYQLIHINGTFHSQSGSGTVAALKRLLPALKIAVITPIHVDSPATAAVNQEELAQGDFVYLLQAQPAKYVNADYRKQMLQRAFKRAETKSCH